MKSNIKEKELRLYLELPNVYGNVVNRYFELTDRHYEDGWRDVVKPKQAENHKLTNLHYDKEKDFVTWDSVKMTEQEIQENQLL